MRCWTTLCTPYPKKIRQKMFMYYIAAQILRRNECYKSKTFEFDW